MNHVTLVGNLTEAPQLRYTQSGKAVCNVTVAVSHRERHNGNWQDVTDGFFTAVAWNTLAENVATSFKKGSRVLVAGRLTQRTWGTEDVGGKRTTTEIAASNIAADLSFATVEITKNEKREPAASTN